MMDERFVLSRIKAHAGDTRDPRRTARDRPSGSRARDPSGPREPSEPSGPRAGLERAPGRRRAGAARPYDLSDPVVQVEREALKLAVQRPACAARV